MSKYLGASGGALHIGGGIAAGQLLGIAASPVLSRLYTPSDFGNLAVFTGVAGLVAILAGLRLNLAIPGAADPVRSAQIAWVGLSVATVVSFGALGVTAVILQASSSQSFGGFWLLLGPCVFLLTLYDLDAGRMIREHRHKRLGLRAFVQMGGQVAVQLLAASRGLGSLGLVAGFSLGRGVAQVVGTGVSRGPYPRPRESARLLWELREYPAKMVPAGLLNTGSLVLPVFMLAAVYGDSEAGSLSLALRILGAPLALIGVALGQVYFGSLSRVLREQPQDALARFRATARRLAVVVALPVLLACLASPWVFPLVFGDQWRTAGVYGLVLAPGLVAQSIVAPLSTTLVAAGRFSWQLLWDLGRFVLLGAIWAAALWRGIDAVWCVGFVSISWALTYGILFALCRRSLAAHPAR